MPNQPTQITTIPCKAEIHPIRHLVTTLALVILSFLSGIYFVQIGLVPFFVKGVPGNQANAICIGSNVCQSANKIANEEGYRRAMDFARENTSKMGFMLNPHFIVATDKTIDGNKINVEFASSLLDIFGEGMTERTLIVGEKTKMDISEARPDDQYAKELLAYEKAKAEFQTLSPEEAIKQHQPLAPSRFIVKTLGISDFKIGDQIRFESATSIRDTSPIEILKVSIVPNAPTLEPPKNLVPEIDIPTADEVGLLETETIPIALPIPVNENGSPTSPIAP